MRAIALTLASFLLAAPAWADPALAQSRLAELTQMTELLEGFTPRTDHWEGALALDEDLWAEASFAVGNEYVVLLASDTLVHGIVVEIVDATDTVVARSELSGAEVLCRFAPSATGTYQIHIVRPIPEAPVASETADLEPAPERPAPGEEAVAGDGSGDGPPAEGSGEAPPEAEAPQRAHFAARLAYR